MQCVRRVVIVLASLTGVAEAQSPANVLVVVNRKSEVSRRIGEYYSRRRAIPRTNTCMIDAPEDETITRPVYDAAIAAPIADCLKSRKLVDQVLYLVTTLGVPLRIDGSSRLSGDRAAVDSELALLYQVIQGKKPPVAGPLANPFFGRRNQRFEHPRVPIYLVCRLAAYRFEHVQRMIDRALAARNRGKVVLDLSSPSNEPGNDWLRSAAMVLPKERVVLDESEQVVRAATGVIAYAGWGSNDSHRKDRLLGFQWLPGAIASEYVSTNGRTFLRPPDTWKLTTWSDSSNWFAGSPQSLTADYLEEGATGASGHVYEPYLQTTPRPDYLIPAYLGGRTLAESYYLALPALSWQNIVVGDPLCRLR